MLNPSIDLFAKLCVALGVFGTIWMTHMEGEFARPEGAKPAVSKSLDTPWRFTRYGWQDSSQWERASFSKPAAATIHPFVWTAMVMLATVGVLVWASNEVEIDSLLRRQSPTRQEPANKSCSDCRKCKNFCLQALVPKNSCCENQGQIPII